MMRNIFVLPPLLFLLSCGPSTDQMKISQEAAQHLDVKQHQQNCIALIGGTMIAQMEDYGYFESMATRYFTGIDIKFRNLGWPADDVFGLARSQFGSAQNTRSWKPPTAEEGFGSKVLMEHILEASPTALLIGYGAELAYEEDEGALEIFKAGYRTLLNFTDSLQIKTILLAPVQQEIGFIDEDQLELRNNRLRKVRDFIEVQAVERKLLFVDLFSDLITAPKERKYTSNGFQLNAKGHHKLAQLLTEKLDISLPVPTLASVDSLGSPKMDGLGRVAQWRETVRGYSFDYTGDRLQDLGKILCPGPFAVRIDGVVVAKGADSLRFYIPNDSTQLQNLNRQIIAKNKLHRYRLRPMNEAYIYLFRRHEMGHLAYEMDDFAALVAEAEYEIKHLLQPQKRRVEIELIRAWKPPRNYPEHEVPANVPTPNIEAEIDAFTLSPGLQINAFATDPMIANPIHISWDTRGRAWVATSSTYPHIVPGREPNDRIVILEDIDKDGQADKSTVFAEGLLVPQSVMPANDGAYVTSSTEFLFLRDTNGDDRADERIVLFDGFGNADVHHMIHGLRWAPWGDLHFAQSIYINTFVETAYGIRKLNGSGIWKFRPETQTLDIFSRGLINPWGHTFDEWGQAFATDGAGFSGISYLFPESAHATAVGAARVLEGLNSGKPKNTGVEVIYSRQLPRHWQGSMVTNDFRANRTVRYQVTLNDGQYSSREVETIAHSEHRSYRPVDAKIGPDGGLYIVDWYNPIIDHGEVDFHHPVRDKSHGRIWRITNQDKRVLSPVNFQAQSVEHLLDLLKSPEQFTRGQANRALVERNCPPKLVSDWISALSPHSNNFEQTRLEGLWLLTALNHSDLDLLRQILNSVNPRARSAAVRILAHWKLQSSEFEILRNLIRDENAQVRLETVNALREHGTKEAIELGLSVMDLPMDENLEFATWLLAKNTQDQWLSIIEHDSDGFLKDPNQRMFALLASTDDRSVPLVAELVENPAVEPELARDGWLKMARFGDADVLQRVLETATNRKDLNLLHALIRAPQSNTSRPSAVDGIISNLLNDGNQSERIAAIQLIDRWKLGDFQSKLVDLISKDSTDTKERKAAFRTIYSLGNADLVKQFSQTGGTLQSRLDATAVWAEVAPEEAAETAVSFLEELTEDEQAEDLFMTFRKSEEGPPALVRALEGKTLKESIAAVGIKVAQSSGFDLGELEEALRRVGSIKPVGTTMSVPDREKLISDAKESGDFNRGRKIYDRPQLLCATCHRIDNIGGLIGPDLSTVGSYMSPNSILESLINPSKDIKQGYETVILNRTNGELVSGTLYRKTDQATLIRMANGEIITIPQEEIQKIDVSPVSLMPAGLTATLHRDELRDLLHYLTNLGVRE